MNSPKKKIEKIKDYFCQKPRVISKENINKIKSAHKKKLRIFDEIESKDILMKKNNLEIKRIKTDSIKQLIYTYQKVPKIWQNQKNYQNQVYEIFSKSPKFLQYLGSASNTNTHRQYYNQEKENNNISNSNTNINSNESRNDNIDFLSKKMKKKIQNLNLSPVSENFSHQKEIPKIMNTTPNVRSYFHKKDETKKIKEIINIFDELSIKYPIKDKIYDLYPNQEIEKINKTERRNIPTIERRKRKQVLKNNIYLNINTTNTHNKNANAKKRKKYNIYTETNLTELKNQIKNPLVLKNLERINFFGPYYSYCSQCGARNIDFYQKLTLRQLNNITNEIKKYRNII